MITNGKKSGACMCTERSKSRRGGLSLCWSTDPHFQEVHVGCYAQQYCHYSIVIYHSPEFGLQFASSVPVGLSEVEVVQGKREGDREEEDGRRGEDEKEVRTKSQEEKREGGGGGSKEGTRWIYESQVDNIPLESEG